MALTHRLSLAGPAATEPEGTSDVRPPRPFSFPIPHSSLRLAAAYQVASPSPSPRRPKRRSWSEYQFWRRGKSSNIIPARRGGTDFFGDSLGVIFPDDVTNQHGDSGHGLVYASPHLPRPIALVLADVEEEADRLLFSHSLWNSSLLIAEFIEAGTLGLGEIGGGGGGCLLYTSPSPRDSL